MALRFKELESGDEWTSGKYRIKAASVSSRQDRKVYHCYYDGLYVAQRNELDEAKEALKAHEDKGE